VLEKEAMAFVPSVPKVKLKFPNKVILTWVIFALCSVSLLKTVILIKVEVSSFIVAFVPPEEVVTT
jgi:hypothetical protein